MLRNLRSIPAVLTLLLVAFVAACGSDEEEAEPQQIRPAAMTERQIRLYFPGDDLRLAPETRTIAVPEDEAASLSPVLEELLEGSATEGAGRLFPPDSKLRATYLLPGGLAVVDIGGPTLVEGWNTGSHEELTAIYAVVQTLVDNFPSVARVRILVNGQSVPTLAGHIILDRSLEPLPWLVAKNAAPQPPPPAPPAARN